MAPPRPVTDAERAQIRTMHAQGKSRNEIARELQRSGRVISRQAADMGLSFDRAPRTAVATAARKEDARAKRAALALALLNDAERLRQQLFEPAMAHNFGGKDNVYAEHEIRQPTFADKRNIAQAVSVLLEKSVRLDEYDAGTGLGQVVSLLDKLGQGLATKYGSGDDEHPVDPDPPADG